MADLRIDVAELTASASRAERIASEFSTAERIADGATNREIDGAIAEGQASAPSPARAPTPSPTPGPAPTPPSSNGGDH
ncbi:hypothetical protein G3N30_09005 [Microbacterium lacticum]|uniref:hypothetical protein n=1 Tax=Microbacterium lacticum TaxID=33885 RepID=UPI0018B04952|nr:hypothetical protein [Microbacterium lacticum]MBF9336355.1 hypothetical protein [Microbacterium lacticum]